MRYSRFASLALLVFFALAPRQPACARQGQGEVVIPKDLTFALELLSPLSTETNKKDDKFDCKVLSPVEYAGATVSGHLRKVKRSGKGNGKSEMDLSFDTITLADGRTGNFNAQVKEVNDVANAADSGRADAIRAFLDTGVSVRKAAELHGVGVSTVQRLKKAASGPASSDRSESTPILTGAAIRWQVLSWTFSDASKPTGHGAAFIAINLASFMPVEEFKQRMDRTIREIRASEKADGTGRIYLPGEMEWERREKALIEGIDLPGDVVASLRGLAEDLNLDFDRSLR